MRTINLKRLLGLDWKPGIGFIVTLAASVMILGGCSDGSPPTMTPSQSNDPLATAGSTDGPFSGGEETPERPAVGIEGEMGPPPLTEEDLLDIDEILLEMDNDLCQRAYATKLELEALIAEGEDLAELESAAQELIDELEQCQAPTPYP